jgi:hypothetical protein
MWYVHINFDNLIMEQWSWQHERLTWYFFSHVLKMCISSIRFRDPVKAEYPIESHVCPFTSLSFASWYTRLSFTFRNCFSAFSRVSAIVLDLSCWHCTTITLYTYPVSIDAINFQTSFACRLMYVLFLPSFCYFFGCLCFANFRVVHCTLAAYFSQASNVNVYPLDATVHPPHLYL